MNVPTFAKVHRFNRGLIGSTFSFRRCDERCFEEVEEEGSRGGGGRTEETVGSLEVFEWEVVREERPNPIACSPRM